MAPLETAAGEARPGAAAPERLLVSLLALGTMAALYLLRRLDDNRLTSWEWVFAQVDPARLFALAAAAIALAVLAARWLRPGRRPGAVLFLSAYAAGACFWGAPEVIVDASRYFTEAKHLEVYGLGYFLAQWGREIPAWTDLPLVPLLHGLVLSAFGESRLAVQAFATLLFAAAVAVTYRLGKALWDEEVGFAAGALLLGAPYLLTQAPAMLVDVPTMFFLALALLAFVQAIQRGGAGRILLASLAVSLAAFTKYSTWLLLSVLPVAWLALRKGGAPRPLRTGLAVAAVSALLVAAALLPRYQTYREQVALLVSYQAPGLRRWGESFATTFLFQVHPFLTAAALLSAGLAFKRRDARYAVALWPVLLLLALRVQRSRYFIPALPMLALMGAYGLRAIAAAEVRRLVLGCTVASSLVVALYGYRPFLERTSSANLKAAGEYLNALPEARAEVFTLSRPDSELNAAIEVPLLDLYTAKPLVYSYRPVPPRVRIAESPLRFTWEYRNPRYYADAGAGGASAVAVITDDLARPLPEEVTARLRGYELARTFVADEGVFRNKTLVAVYRPAPP